MKYIVVHLITGLGKGGTETMLYQILKFQSNPSIKYRVISMGKGSFYNEKIKELGIDVKVFNFKKHPVLSFVRMCGILKNIDVLCCWMYHANFVGYIVGKIARVKKIIWNIRHSDLSKELNKSTTLLINKWCAKHSRKVSQIIFNGFKARKAHEAIGYCWDNCVVAVNGVDTDEYKQIPKAKEQIYNELGIPKCKKILLSVTKYHPIKDITSFLMAFCEIRRKQNNIIAVMCGNGIEPSNIALVDKCQQLDLVIGKDIYLLGLRDDVPNLLSACDLYVLHSAGEAFPNTLIQAMSCGCLCLTTNVGDAGKILGDSLCVIPPKNYYALAQSELTLLNLNITDAEEKKVKNRKRVMNDYSIGPVVQQYESLYLKTFE